MQFKMKKKALGFRSQQVTSRHHPPATWSMIQDYQVFWGTDSVAANCFDLQSKQTSMSNTEIRDTTPLTPSKSCIKTFLLCTSPWQLLSLDLTSQYATHLTIDLAAHIAQLLVDMYKKQDLFGKIIDLVFSNGWALNALHQSSHIVK